MLHDQDSYAPDPPVDPQVSATHPVAIPGGRTENRISSFYQHREDHHFGAGAHAESTREFSRQRDAEVMVSGTNLLPFIPSSSIIQGNSFSGAHHFVVNNPIMVADTASETERKMMKLLRKKALVDATYDSAARHDTAPHCHPDTCVPLREYITAWLRNMNREEPLFWLYGPAGAGKSAIAQSLMEYCAEHDIPGAGIFLSRANKRNDPNRIIPSLAHQLAIAHPAYRRAITNLLSTDSTVLEKRLRHQFQQLIDKPADVFGVAGSSNVPSHPILILIDGLDECHTETAQCELVRLIAYFASRCRGRGLPFVCVITSRPEWQIVSTFDQFGTCPKVWQVELRMDTPEALRDVEVALRAGFSRIRNKNNDAFSGKAEWPTQGTFHTIKTAVSGNMLFASIIVNFIDDDDPNTQLELCLKFLRGNLTSDEQNPFDPLAALYQGMLRSIPPSLLSRTLQILYLRVLNNDYLHLTAQTSASFFHIDQPTFYLCLRKLRSVIRVPPPSEAGERRLEFFHTTFADYLKVAIQTGSFGLYEVDALDHIRTRCMQWHDMLGGNKDKEFSSGIVSWHGKGTTDQILKFSRLFLFKLWDDLFHQGNLVRLQEELRHFTFKDLPRGLVLYDDNESIWGLVKNLMDYQNKCRRSAEDCIVRTTPVWPTDHKLLEKYRSLISQWGASVETLDLTVADHAHDMSFIIYSADDPFDDFNAASRVSEIQWCPRLAYVLLGYQQNAVLVIVCPKVLGKGVFWEGASERIKAAHLASSALGNLWPINLEHVLVRFHSQLSQGMGKDDKQGPKITKDSLESTLVSFIADAQRNPWARLEVVIETLSTTHDPYKIVHLLFQYTLQSIPGEMQSVAQRVMAFLLSLDSGYLLHSKNLEQMLHLDRATIHRVVWWLHPFVFSWSPPSDSNTLYLQTKLPCYDLQQNRIDLYNEFHIDEQAWQEVFALWIQFGSSYLRTGHHFFLPSAVDEWAFLRYASRALRSIHTSHGLAAAAIELRKFPFCHPKVGARIFETAKGGFFLGLKALIHRLSQLVSVMGHVIRDRPICEMDRLLLEKWMKMGHDFEFAKFPFTREAQQKSTFCVVSLHADSFMPSVQRVYRIFLLGEGHNTCLIAMWPYSTWDDIDRGCDEDET